MGVLFRYKNALSSKDFNLRFADVLGGSILKGFYFKPGSGDLKLTITFGDDDTSVLIMPNGARIEETKELFDVLTIPENTYNVTRIDSVYIRYVHGAKNNAEIEYLLFEGDENGEPIIELNREEYLLLGEIHLPPNVTALESTFFRYPSRGIELKDVANKLDFLNEVHFKEKITLKNGAIAPTPIEPNDVVTKEYVDKKHITYDSVESADYDLDKGIFLTSIFKRQGKVLATSEVSDFDADGRFQLLTCTYYEEDGETVHSVESWSFTYDGDGNIVSKTKLSS